MLRFLLVLACAAASFAQTSDYDRGVALFRAGDYAGAEPFLLRAAEAQPRQAGRWAALGVLYAAQSMYDLAEPPLKRACDLDPKLPDVCYYEARALYALDRFEASLDALKRAAAIAPDSWRVHLAIAQSWEALANPKQAETEFREALRLEKATPQPDAQPGEAYAAYLLRQARSDEAIALLEEVLLQFPNSADAHLNLGRALLEKNRVAESIPHLETAVALARSSVQAQLLLAKAYVRAGRPADARPHFEAARRATSGEAVRSSNRK